MSLVYPWQKKRYKRQRSSISIEEFIDRLKKEDEESQKFYDDFMKRFYPNKQSPNRKKKRKRDVKQPKGSI